MMNALQVIAELGGVGAVGNVAAGFCSLAFNGWRDAITLTRGLTSKDKDAEDRDAKGKREFIAKSDHAKTVVRFIVFVSFMVISAPVWFPLFGIILHFFYTIYGYADLAPTIAGVWYFPKDGSFFLFEWSNLREYRIGPEDADYVFGVTPVHFAICTNIVAFYFLNRRTKKLN